MCPTVKIATVSGKKIGDLVRERSSHYSQHWLDQHCSTLRRHVKKSAFFVHFDNHLPKWSQTIIKWGLAPGQKKTAEAALLQPTNNFNNAPVSHEHEGRRMSNYYWDVTVQYMYIYLLISFVLYVLKKQYS